jgi:hypothetical protein
VAHRLIGQVIPVRIEGLSLSQHVYLIHDRKALHTAAVGAWWKFITSKVGQQKPLSDDEPEPLELPAVAPESQKLVSSKASGL